MESLERVRDALADSRTTSKGPSGFMAQCPVHDDGRPSLSVDYRDGRTLLYCMAGCATDEVVEALGLALEDLFDDEPDDTKAVVSRSYTYRRSNGEPWIVVDRYYPKSFRQRLPGTQPGDRGGLQGREPILYRAERLWPAIKEGDATVYVVEGEKDVEACERHGLLATCPMMGAGKWRDSYTRFLRGAGLVVIVADQDPVKSDGSLGAGHEHALAVRAALKAAGVEVKVVKPREGKDAADHFAAGYGPDDFEVDPRTSIRPRGMTGTELMTADFPTLSFALEPLLPEGLAILAGSPKSGKSWIALSISLAVAMGGAALGTQQLKANQGSVLYVAREDGYRRLQSRIRHLSGGQDWANLEKLELIPTEKEWEGGIYGLAVLSEWAEEVGDPRLVVLDTLGKVEPDMGEERGKGAYSGNYSMMARYKQWADDHHCTVLMIHHDRKANDDGGDPFTRISGTRGITGAADTMLFLERERGTDKGVLHVTGRDVLDQALEMRKAGPVWSLYDAPEGY